MGRRFSAAHCLFSPQKKKAGAFISLLKPRFSDPVRPKKPPQGRQKMGGKPDGEIGKANAHALGARYINIFAVL
jgi:hypothetical protein